MEDPKIPTEEELDDVGVEIETPTGKPGGGTNAPPGPKPPPPPPHSPPVKPS